MFELNMSGNQVTDISILSELTYLEELYLGGNEISDFSVLEGLPFLSVLEAEVLDTGASETGQ